MTGPTAAPAQAVHSRTQMLRNTLVLAVGRNLIALSRLAILAIVARGLGTQTFGQYALLIALMMVAEGLLDFGSNEVFVREVAAQPQRRSHLLRVLAAGRLLHAPVVWCLLVLAAWALGHDREVLEAAAVAGLSLVFLGGVMVYRVIFRTELSMEHEIAAEFISVVFMVLALLVVARQGGGIVALMACHAASRALFFVLVAWFGRQAFRYSVAGVSRADLLWSWRLCLSVGLAGALVMLYDPMDVLLLSRLGGFGDTARFAAAQRLAWPLLIALAAIGGTLYTVVAAAWPHDLPRLERACQRGFDVVIVFGLAGVCAAWSGAEALLALIAPELAAGGPAFGVLVTLCVVKAISMTLGPVLLVVGAQRVALAIVGGALLVKVLVSLVVIPRFGFVGLAWAALVVETGCVAIPAVLVVSQRAGIQLRYGTALRATGLCVASILLVRHGPLAPGLLTALAAPVLYGALALLTGTLRRSELSSLKSPEPAP